MIMMNRWNVRILQTQMLLMYPLFISSYPPQEVGATGRTFLVATILLVGFLCNKIFIQDTIKIFTCSLGNKDLFLEYVWIFIVGCTNIYLFSCLYHLFGVRSGEQIIQRDWATSIYFSIVTWTTLGYGDFSPVESLRLVAATEAMMGYIYMAVLVGILLNLSGNVRK